MSLFYVVPPDQLVPDLHPHLGAFRTGDCATYWLAPTADGRRDLDAVEDVYRSAGCLDRPAEAGGVEQVLYLGNGAAA
ncbi:hypothetical protein [Pseudonocardia sp. ICBG601]|uniref:hypothetical protein n=1 Tax=Pseudonocardia sp. ICBG601 TaxID=2846759 RepID=UPI001CF6DAF8|nr:hypothetical protein [Pseudonocardia sp. ICBG601]